MNGLPRKSSILILTVLAFVTGYFFVVTVKSYTVSYESETAPKYQEIITYIEQLETDTTQLEQNIRDIRSETENLREQFPQDTLLSTQLQNEIASLNAGAGLTELTGKGISVILDDNAGGAELAQKANPQTYKAENYIVHYTDLLYIIRELAPYAEGITLNDIRITDNYNIRCVGTVIMLNSTRLAPPYRINAIGDSMILETALNTCSQFVYLKNNNMPVKYSLDNELTLPAAISVVSTSGLEAADQ